MQENATSMELTHSSRFYEAITTLEEAMKNENAKRNLADTAEQVYRLWR